MDSSKRLAFPQLKCGVQPHGKKMKGTLFAALPHRCRGAGNPGRAQDTVWSSIEIEDSLTSVDQKSAHRKP
jgi:hypothetical protein